MLLGLFAGETDWLAPVNLASWEAASKPAGLRVIFAKAGWVHEVQYPQISLCAQPLTVRLLAFSHVIRAVFSVCECPWTMQGARTDSATLGRLVRVHFGFSPVGCIGKFSSRGKQ